MEEEEDFEVPVRARASRADQSSVGDSPAVAGASRLRTQPASKLLEGLKEELFELEVEHKQGRITQQEYEKTKAALDHTLERALKRENQRA
jgi:hypothetical protein